MTLNKKDAVGCWGGNRTLRAAGIYIINIGIQGMEIKFKESAAYHNGGVVVCPI